MNSTVSLKITLATYDDKQPHLVSGRKTVYGSGFVFDLNNGLIATNSNNVEDSVSIIARLPKMGSRDLTVKLISICPEKKIAVCQFQEYADILDRVDKKNLASEFGDSMKIRLGDSVDLYSFTNNQKIKFNRSVITGFTNFNLKEIEDSYDRLPCCYEVDCQVETTGGPVFNHEGKVIGIVLSSVNNQTYIIPSRTFLAVYHGDIGKGLDISSKGSDMSSKMSEINIKMPTMGLAWSKTNKEIMKKQTGSSSTYGFYVRKLLPESCLDTLQKGDIIRRMDFIDNFWDTKGDFHLIGKNRTLVTVLFDRFGLTTSIGKLSNPDELNEEKLKFDKIFTERKMDLNEIADIIPIGTDITVNLCRNAEWYKLTSQYIFSNNENKNIKDYLILAGIIIDCKNTVKYVYPESYAGKSQIIHEGQIIKSVVGYKLGFEIIEETNKIVSNLNDIRAVMALNPDLFQITTMDDYTFIVEQSTIVTEKYH